MYHALSSSKNKTILEMEILLFGEEDYQVIMYCSHVLSPRGPLKVETRHNLITPDKYALKFNEYFGFVDVSTSDLQQQKSLEELYQNNLLASIYIVNE